MCIRDRVWKDEGRAAMLADIYNRKLNRVAPRAYSGDYLSLPGMSPDIQLRKHQRDAVARIIQDGEGTLIAHTVGAGKTFTGITAMHELKQMCIRDSLSRTSSCPAAMFAISLSTSDPRFRHSTISSRGSTTTVHPGSASRHLLSSARPSDSIRPCLLTSRGIEAWDG